MAAYDRLSVQDRLHLDLEDSATHMHVAGVMVFEAGPLLRDNGGVHIDRLRDYLEAQLHRIPRYRQRLATIPVEDHPVWVDDPCFNIEYHVRHVRLPLPGDDEQLEHLVGRVVSQQLDRGKPLWEIWVVEGLEDDRVAMITKVHHCMADGIHATELMAAMLRLEPVKRFDAAPAWFPRPVPDSGRLLRDAVSQRLRAPVEIAGALGSALRRPQQTAVRVREGAQALRQSRQKPASESPLNRPIGPHRRFHWLSFEFDEIRHVRKCLGGTVNDVVLASVAGAMGEFFERRGIPRWRQAEMEFRVACPVNIRREGDHLSGNQVSSIAVPLPLAETDPVRRLERVSERTRELKAGKQQLAVEIVQQVAEYTWPGLYSGLARSAIEQRATNMIVSNVPGPPVPFYLLESRLLEAYPLIPLLPGQALSMGVMTYAGGAHWGLNADWDLIPDLPDLVVALDRSFRELCNAADEVALSSDEDADDDTPNPSRDAAPNE